MWGGLVSWEGVEITIVRVEQESERDENNISVVI